MGVVYSPLCRQLVDCRASDGLVWGRANRAGHAEDLGSEWQPDRDQGLPPSDKSSWLLGW